MKRKNEQTAEKQEMPRELKKHVAVIHSGSSKLTLLQRKIANALLFNAYKDMLTKDEHEIHVATLCDLIGYSSNDHKTIKNALVNLLSTVLQWNLVDGERLNLKEEGVWNASSIISDASIDGPVCTYSYSNKMKKLLYRPNVYGRLDMLVQSRFQSGYGLALYENCNRFQDIGRTPWIEIEKFRLLMGVKDGQYKIFRDLKNRVIDKAVEEVNKYSSIKLTPEYRKQGRKVIAIQFIIQKEGGNVVGLPHLIDDQSKLPEILKVKFGLSKKQIEEILSKYELNFIYEKIELIENSASYKSGKIKNLARYLLSALSDDYQPNKRAEAIQFTEGKKQVKEDEFQIQKRKEQEADYRRYQNREIFVRFKQLDEKERNGLLKQFEKYLVVNGRGGLYLTIYERDGLNNGLVLEFLCTFLRKEVSSILIGIKSFEEWQRLNYEQ